MEQRTEPAKTFWQRDGVFLLLLLLIFVLRYTSSILRGDLFGPFRDNIWIYGPIFSRASEIALHGSCPYWLDTMLTGYPLFDSPHFSITYPFYFLGWINYGIELDAVFTLTRLTFFHLLILYLNSYAMIRLAGGSGFGALCGATLALIGGSTVGYSTWITIIASYSWLPLLIGSAIWLLKRPGFASALLLSASASLLIIASPAQSVIHALLFCLCFFACALPWFAKNQGTGHALKIILSLLVALVFVAGLTAVATIPMTIDTAGMIRHVGDRTAVIGHQRIPWQAFTSHQLEPAQLWHVCVSSWPLGILGGPYIGPLGVAGVTLSWLRFRGQERFGKFLVIFSTLFAIYGLLAGLGTHSGITQLHFHLPLLNRIREAGRHLIWFTIFVSLLTGLGFDTCTRHFRLSLSGGIGAAIVASGLWIVELVIAYRSHTWNWFPLCVIPVGLVLLYLARIAITPLVATGLIFSGLAAAIAHNGTTPSYLASYYDPGNLTALRVIQGLTNLPGIYTSRVAFRDSAFWPGHWAMDASFYGIRSFYMNMTPVPYDQFWDMNRESLPNYRELMGARYLVCGEKEKPRSDSDTLLFQDGQYRVYRLANSMPLTVLVHELGGYYSDAAQFYSRINLGFDYNRIAYVSQPDYNHVSAFLRQRSPLTEEVPDFVQIVKSDFNNRTLCVATSAPSVLILNEYYNKSWHARVNGREVPLLRVNLNQIGVLLRQGRNIVHFEYKPALFWKLLILQRATFAILVLTTAIAAYSVGRSASLKRSSLVKTGAISPDTA
jgi:hypothetical protein